MNSLAELLNVVAGKVRQLSSREWWMLMAIFLLASGGLFDLVVYEPGVLRAATLEKAIQSVQGEVSEAEKARKQAQDEVESLGAKARMGGSGEDCECLVNRLDAKAFLSKSLSSLTSVKIVEMQVGHDRPKDLPISTFGFKIKAEGAWAPVVSALSSLAENKSLILTQTVLSTGTVAGLVDVEVHGFFLLKD